MIVARHSTGGVPLGTASSLRPGPVTVGIFRCRNFTVAATKIVRARGYCPPATSLNSDPPTYSPGWPIDHEREGLAAEHHRERLEVLGDIKDPLVVALLAGLQVPVRLAQHQAGLDLDAWASSHRSYDGPPGTPK